MGKKYALKRLTASDLTFFEWHFRNNPSGNQKAINLNADIFVKRLYPSITDAAKAHNNRLSLDLWLAGPGGQEPLNLQRKIVKGGTYKNWRLNGEFIVNPSGDNERFNILQPSDFVLFAFEGEIVPSSATAVFVAQDHDDDKVLHKKFDKMLGGQKMASLSEEELVVLCESANLEESHFLAGVTLDRDLSDAAIGISSAVEKLIKRKKFGTLSAEALRKGRAKADEVGATGEELIDHYLSERRMTGKVESYVWKSALNAIVPYDFSMIMDGEAYKLDVKSTSGGFDREFHISINELREMAAPDCAYYIYRVYGVNEETVPELRISEDMTAFAENVLKAFEGVPKGVTPDGVSVSTDVIPFDDPVVLNIPISDDD